MTGRIVAPEPGPLTPPRAPGSPDHGQPWHALRPSEVVAHLGANLDAGLTDDEVRLAVLFGLQWLTVSAPPLARLLGTASLGAADWTIVLVGVLWPVLAMEMGKLRRAPMPPSHG